MLAALALAGPSGPTNDNTPTFTWEGTGATCAVDGADPTPCSSPVTLPPLVDGPHSFEVTAGGEREARTFRVDTVAPELTVDGPSFTAEDGADTTCAVGDAPATPCTSPWSPNLPNGSHALHVTATDAAGNATTRTRMVQVSVSDPETTITAGPSGDTEDAQPLFAFAGGASYVCTLDGVAVECGPSFQTPALNAGEHTLTVAARDAAGNVDPTPAQRTFRVVACQTGVTLGAVKIAAKCLADDGTGTLVTSGAIKLNGITLNPERQVRITPETRRIRIPGVQLKLGTIVLFRGNLDFTVPAEAKFRLATIDLTNHTRTDEGGDSEAALDLEGSDDSNVAGFPLKGLATLDLDNGATVLDANIELPEVFTDAEGKGLTGHLKLSADNEQGVRLDEAKVTAPLAFIGKLELHDLFVSFTDKGTGPVSSTCNTETPGLRWEGGASAIVVPVPGNLRLEDVGVGFADGALSHAEATWKPSGDGAALGGGVKVQKLSVSLCTGPPLVLAGRAALTALPGADGKPRLTIPDAGLKFTAGDPWTIRAEAPLANLNLGTPMEFKDLYVAVNSAGGVDFGGGVSFALDLKGNVVVGDLEAALRVDASLKGFFEGSKFNADLKATGCFGGTLTVGAPIPFSDICPQVDGVISSTGIAVCGGLVVGGHNLGRIGAGLKWGGPLEFMGSACDVGRWRVEKSAGAAAMGERTVRVPAGERAVLVAVEGADRAPQVTLSGRGTSVTTAAQPTGTTKTATAASFSSTAQRTTYIALRAPRGGRYTVRSSEPIRSVSAAPLLAPAKVRGALRDGVLRYRTDQPVKLIERGRGVNRVLGTVTGKGLMRFTPATGRGGTRRIEAIVERNGERRTLATYTAKGRAKPAKPSKVSVKHNVIRWSGKSQRYGVRVSVSDGRDLFFLTRGRTLRVPGIDRRAVSVRVVGLRADNTHGPAGTARSPKR
ncbi:hypothetical protein DVA67_026860 [Solirubrobacter sp. CPCC 204708]|uniref:Bacterial Ig-like domain-containing protein n=1 Tax=Solirubrobacter deserti TaxID=2282478 RepID=A0ABT4RGH4_9ACTN|nr:hypothetical protein [Solirubrobacter deserti]MBE2319618.1 hypothetical protein [Solirubrobacter deserti]MDA0137643.1 hypothetical protein [Solirubrobacter deserti]